MGEPETLGCEVKALFLLTKKSVAPCAAFGVPVDPFMI